MAQIVVSTEALLSQASTVEGLIKRVSAGFDTMKQKINNTNSYWIGEAGDVHRQKYISQQQTIDEIIRRLTENVTDLRAMAGVYEQAERSAEAEAEALVESVID